MFPINRTTLLRADGYGASGVRLLVIQGGRQLSVLQCQQAGHKLGGGATRPQTAKITLRGEHGNCRPAIPKYLVESARFPGVSLDCAIAVRINMIDIFEVCAGFLQGGSNSPCQNRQ